jgi:type IV secretion system protein VirB1
MDFATLAAECAPWVAPQTMAAIVKTESQFNPLAININAGARLERQPQSKQEAAVTAKWLIANNYNIDMGLGQVNSVNLAKTKLSVEDAFDPCKNLAAAATILQWNYASASKRIPNEQEALQAAISAYNTGSFSKGFTNGYVQKVVNNAQPIKEARQVKSAVIAPIRLINVAKTKPENTINNGSVDIAAVKLKSLSAEEAANDNQQVVYEENLTAREVMVYR